MVVDVLLISQADFRVGHPFPSPPLYRFTTLFQPVTPISSLPQRMYLLLDSEQCLEYFRLEGRVQLPPLHP